MAETILSDDPKIRKARFTSDESQALVAEYSKYKVVVESKFSDNVYLSKKKKAWEKIALVGNSLNPSVVRTVPEFFF